jgi:hypothetical protein
MSHSSAGASSWLISPGRRASSSRRAETPLAPLGPAPANSALAAAGRRARCSGCSRPCTSTPTTASTSGTLSRRLNRAVAALPPRGASAGIVTIASLDSFSALSTPAINAAAGPPPGGLSIVKITGRATSRTGPTTTTVKSCGREASARSSNGSSPTSSSSLSGGKRCDAPPARTTAVTRRNEGWLLVRVRTVVLGRIRASGFTGAIDTGGCLGSSSSRDDLHGLPLDLLEVVQVVRISP